MRTLRRSSTLSSSTSRSTPSRVSRPRTHEHSIRFVCVEHELIYSQQSLRQLQYLQKASNRSLQLSNLIGRYPYKLSIYLLTIKTSQYYITSLIISQTWKRRQLKPTTMNYQRLIKPLHRRKLKGAIRKQLSNGILIRTRIWIQLRNSKTSAKPIQL
ncbi:hypothetical protein FGO68_gene8557 [Halteria grandinella]|uniref:Uncharacterized protein n=1 Tax=Halteria grandinella TaxID=5974 RepID=A0A8J8NDX8_HALGN|nr:hypothetical protein FGO68_gene8557 [Halteria grandinella]